MDLIEFLRARLDEDEAMARVAEHADGPRTLAWRPGGSRRLRFDNQRSENYSTVFAGDWDRILIARDDTLGGPLAAHIARWDPARILAEVEAKRQALLTRGQGVCTCGPGNGYENPPTDPDTREPIPHHYDCAAYEAALMFVQVYADHPDFDPAWLAVSA